MEMIIESGGSVENSDSMIIYSVPSSGEFHLFLFLTLSSVCSVVCYASCVRFCEVFMCMCRRYERCYASSMSMHGFPPGCVWGVQCVLVFVPWLCLVWCGRGRATQDPSMCSIDS